MVIREGPRRRIIRQWFAVLSAIGLLISLWAQAVSVAGLDPRDYFPKIWTVEPSLAVVLLPLILSLFRNGVKNNPFGLTKQSLLVLYCLTGYYLFQFYRFLFRAAIELRSSDGWQMFSAGWIVLFTLALFYYLKPRPVRSGPSPQTE